MTKQQEHLKAIKIHKQTCEKLDAIRHLGQSYDGVIRELIAKWNGNGKETKVELPTAKVTSIAPFKPAPKPSKK